MMIFQIIIKNRWNEKIKNESNNILNPPNKSAENATNAYIKNKIDRNKDENKK